jgi:hypothetical protein
MRLWRLRKISGIKQHSDSSKDNDIPRSSVSLPTVPALISQIPIILRWQQDSLAVGGG